MIRVTTTFAIGDLADRVVTLKGRYAWALAELIRAGKNGCTPIDNPGPRWSAYVHKLRHEYGLQIDTLHEPHAGQFAGTHARYILQTPVSILEDMGVAA